MSPGRFRELISRISDGGMLVTSGFIWSRSSAVGPRPAGVGRIPAEPGPRSHSLREPSLLGSYLACGVSALRVSIACADPHPARLGSPPSPKLGRGDAFGAACEGVSWRHHG